MLLKRQFLVTVFILKTKKSIQLKKGLKLIVEQLPIGGREGRWLRSRVLESPPPALSGERDHSGSPSVRHTTDCGRALESVSEDVYGPSAAPSPRISVSRRIKRLPKTPSRS